MDDSALWKTEETIIGLSQFPVLSGFSRFGGCHLSLPLYYLDSPGLVAVTFHAPARCSFLILLPLLSQAARPPLPVRRSTPSCLLHRTAFPLQFHLGDAIGRHTHLLEPVGCGLLVGGFQDADGLALGQATKASIALDHGVLLSGLGHLVDLFAGHAARRQSMNAHEFRHRDRLLS